jgi:hypothetical protein
MLNLIQASVELVSFRALGMVGSIFHKLQQDVAREEGPTGTKQLVQGRKVQENKNQETRKTDSEQTYFTLKN